MGAARLRGQQRGGGRACPLHPADSGARSGLAPGMLGSEPCPAPPVGSGGPPRPIFTFQEGSTMAEKTSPGPGGGITPLQQMLASGTGAILTSLFGEGHGAMGGGSQGGGHPGRRLTGGLSLQ